MIIYFSGTGNSQHVAEMCGKELGEEVYFLTSASPLNIEFSGNTLGIITPIYSWGIPPIVLNYIKQLNESFISKATNVPVWIILVCGDDTGKAPQMLSEELKHRGLELSGGWSIQMPNNYVLLPGFNVDSKEVEREKLDAAKGRIIEIAQKISSQDWEMNFKEGSFPRLKTKLVYPLFKHWGIFPSRWYHTDSCISCGKCEKVCPVKNITMKPGNNSQGKEFPSWGSNCTSCLACYHICPKNAVQYGKATKRKGQYFFPSK